MDSLFADLHDILSLISSFLFHTKYIILYSLYSLQTCLYLFFILVEVVYECIYSLSLVEVVYECIYPLSLVEVVYDYIYSFCLVEVVYEYIYSLSLVEVVYEYFYL